MSVFVLQEEGEGGGACIASDLPRGVALLADLTTSLHHAQAAFDTLAQRIRDGDLTTEKGISLLELKNQSFLSYLANLTFVTLSKLKGNKIEGSASIGRLVEQRVVLERLRPIEEKLKYQLDKHIKAATEGVATADDPSRLKGDLDNIGSSSSEDEEEEQQGGGGGKKKKKKEDGSDSDDGKTYKAPKISQMKYDLEDDKDKAKDRARRRVLNSSMLRDNLEDYTEDPEVVHNIDVLQQRSIKKRKQLEEYEESNMIRKQLSKKERADQSRITTIGTMGSEMLGFTSLNPLHDTPEDQPPGKRQKTSASAKAKKGKKGGKGKKGFGSLGGTTGGIVVVVLGLRGSLGEHYELR
ncbi:Neuroguidin [Chionoecetes opilio]|uniref:Neuroguidin n=1 Tax=Chionoecetes opilio TaxID=41210 RepID=A0A8J5BY70_CHIOP|nr:Neuroguidin [Chionoecetes opilio]